MTNEVDIANNARCCGQTADRKADNPPVNPPTITEWSGCAAECTDPRDENPSCDDQELCVRTVGLMTLSKFSTGQGPEQQETFELIPYVCGDKFRQRTNLDIGLRWQDIGTTQPTEGRLITNVALANALQSRTEFDQDELNAFGTADCGRTITSGRQAPTSFRKRLKIAIWGMTTTLTTRHALMELTYSVISMALVQKHTMKNFSADAMSTRVSC